MSIIRKIQYWIVDTLSALSIKYDWYFLEKLTWRLKWYQTEKWYGEQSEFPIEYTFDRTEDRMSIYYGRDCTSKERKIVDKIKVLLT